MQGQGAVALVLRVGGLHRTDRAIDDHPVGLGKTPLARAAKRFGIKIDFLGTQGVAASRGYRRAGIVANLDGAESDVLRSDIAGIGQDRDHKGGLVLGR